MVPSWEMMKVPGTGISQDSSPLKAGMSEPRLFKSLGSDLPAFNGDESWELPVPGTFIISQDGTIRLAYADADYTRRLEPSALLESLRTMSK